MRLILTHDQADLDAIASMHAAKILDEAAIAVLPAACNLDVQAFLADYGEELGFTSLKNLPPGQADSVLLVDTQALVTLKPMHANTKVSVIDHHPRRAQSKPDWQLEIRSTGACTTILVAKIRERGLTLNPLQASLLLMGIYEDTGSLAYTTTTPEDVYAAAWLLEQGADLNLVAKYLETPLSSSQKTLFDRLLRTTESLELEGKTILLAHADAQDMQDEISSVAHRLRDFFAGDGLVIAIATRQGVRIVGRSTTDEIDMAKLARKFGGGGHLRAASALVHREKHGSVESVRNQLKQVFEEVKNYLPEIVARGLRVADLMSSAPLTLDPDQDLEEIHALMLRYGFEGFPVVEGGRVIGLVNRRSVDRAIAHKLQADARALMDAGEVSLQADASVQELRDLMTSSGWGQIPVIGDGKIIGIVTRTDLMKANKETYNTFGCQNLAEKLESGLPAGHFGLLRLLAGEAKAQGLGIYIVGGFVRDLILSRPSLDFDVVIEGNAIEFAQALEAKYGGHAVKHGAFGTAKWQITTIHEALAELTAPGSDPHESELPETIDLISARNEYYLEPAALPVVEPAGIKLDLRRRDFSINTLAVRLDPEHFGDCLDYWGGFNDLKEGLIRVLHALSFVDDATRILRGVRFAVRFKFTIEPRTMALLMEGRKHLRSITPARLRNELDLLFSEEKALEILHKLNELEVLESIEPNLCLQAEAVRALQSLSSPLPAPDWLTAIPKSSHLSLRQALAYALWLSNLERKVNPYLFRRLNLPSWLQETIWELGEFAAKAGELPSLKPSEQVAFLEALDPFTLYAAWLSTDKPELKALIDQFMSKLRKVKPKTNGKALIALGLAPSADFSNILKRLRAAWLDGEINTEAEEETLLKSLLKSK